MKRSKHVPEEYRDYFQHEDNIEEIEETISHDNAFAEDTQKLYSLIKDLCERGEKVEFVACWAGTENIAPEIELYQRTTSNDLMIDFSSGRDATLKITFEK
ncbi:hypothetical protein [Rufibacter hautae]|uniref:Uncharacterized protein n=1 Tax=Rufibacter hautae TaxID=2595005 RepID=A0A5B6TF81_9BACT|nr:hypothetical protein [Rufibacter hautae]KAA3437930.1 hypothetical protein FOA19_11645 [Rufibacter hautae]